MWNSIVTWVSRVLALPNPAAAAGELLPSGFYFYSAVSLKIPIKAALLRGYTFFGFFLYGTKRQIKELGACTVPKKLSESPHKDQACHSWSR